MGQLSNRVLSPFNFTVHALLSVITASKFLFECMFALMENGLCFAPVNISLYFGVVIMLSENIRFNE